MKQIFIGNEEEYLSKIATDTDKSAFLLNKHNVNKFLSNTPDKFTVYTSLGDMPKNLNIFWKVLNTADVVHYCPPEHWKKLDNNNFYYYTDTEEGLLEFLILKISAIKKVVGLKYINNTPGALEITNHRTTDDVCLFAAGCSVTYGIGVDPNNSYAFLLSQSLHKTLISLSKPATSILWSADQILRSDIRKNDIVVWGLTNLYRFTGYYENSIHTCNPAFYHAKKVCSSIVPINYTVSEDNMQKNLCAIDAVTNFCEKIGAKLYMFEALPPGPEITKFTFKNERFFDINLNLEFDSTRNCFTCNYLDRGSDNRHPGALQHKKWHDDLLKIIQSECIL